MSSKKKRQELHVAKQRRQKKIAIGGGVLLAILLAIQAPKLMHHGSSAPTVSPLTTTTTPGTATTETPSATTPGVAAGTPGAVPTAAAATSTTPAKLPNSDVAPVRRRTQLASFELFDSKDPFVQQVVPAKQAPAAAALTPTTPGAPASTAPAAPSTSGSAPPPTSSATMSAVQPNPTARTLASAGTAVIAVNGKSESIGVNQTFPSSSPTFKLVSVSGGVAMIGIANGGYASGAQTVALQLGKSLTLVDTTDSIRYELRLVSVS